MEIGTDRSHGFKEPVNPISKLSGKMSLNEVSQFDLGNDQNKKNGGILNVNDIIDADLCNIGMDDVVI